MPPRLFYSALGLNVEIYDERTRLEGTSVDGDVDFYLELARQTGGPVLELAAGTGRVSLPLAQAGFEVVGLDLSTAMISRAVEKSRALPPEVRARVRFLHGDMADFQLDRKFALVLIPYRAFQALLDPRLQRRALAAIHAHQDPGGRLAIDLFDPRLDHCLPESGRAPREEASVAHPATENRVTIEVLERTNDPLTQVLRETWRFREVDGSGRILREEEESLALRWTYRWEMRYLLELSGFEVEADYSDFHGSPPAYGGDQVWLARRR